MHLHKTNKKVKPVQEDVLQNTEYPSNIKTNKRNGVYKCLFWNKDTNFFAIAFSQNAFIHDLKLHYKSQLLFFCIYLGRSGKWFTQLTYARNVLSLPLVCVSLHQTKISFSSFIPVCVTIASFAESNWIGLSLS